MPVTDQMVQAAYKVFRKGPPGVVRRIQHIDSYPGERVAPDDPPDPQAYQPIPTTIKDEEQAIREIVETVVMSALTVKVTFSDQAHGDQGPEELELGPFLQGAVIEIGAGYRPELIDVATSTPIARLTGDTWGVNLPREAGNVMPICFYRKVFVQGLSSVVAEPVG